MKLCKKFEVVPQVTMVVSILSHGHPWLDDDFGGPPWLGNPPLIDINPWLRVQLDLQPFRNLLDEGHILPWRSAHGFFGICLASKVQWYHHQIQQNGFFFLQLFIAIPLGTNIIYGTNMEKCENRHQHLDLAKWLLHSHRQVFVSKHLPSFRIWWVGDECHHVSSSNQHKLVGDFPINPPQLEFTRRTSQNDLGKCGITMDTHGFHTWNHSLLDLRVEVHREVPATGKSQGAS